MPHGKALYAMILGILLVVAIFAGVLFRDSGSSAAIPEVVTESTDDPDETPIPDDYNWVGKDTEPKYITLPTIKAEGFIQKVAVDQRNEVGVPSNVHLAGWFNKMAIPGEKGLSIIDGHVDGRSEPGIFKNLGKLDVGDSFTIEYGSGDKQNFKVTSKAKATIEDSPAVLFSQDPEQTSQLNLITCGGTYDKSARRYLERIIVTSVPV